jgi:titin
MRRRPDHEPPLATHATRPFRRSVGLGRLAAIAALLVTSTIGVGTLATGVAGATGSTGSISGTVTEPDGSPAVGVDMEVAVGTGDLYGATTASDGTYSITGLPATVSTARYEFSVTPPDDTAVYDFYAHPMQPTALTSGQNLTGENTRLVTPGSVSGTVTVHGAPVDGADIQIYDPNSYPNGNPPESGATTDSSGNYTATGLVPGGPYIAQFDGTGLVTMYWNDALEFTDATPVTITSGGTTTGIDAAMIALSQVSGTVRDHSGNPVAGADVQLENVDPNSFTYLDATTGSDGGYTVTGVIPGSYTVLATPTGSTLEPTTRENPLTVGAEATLTGIDVTLPPVDSTTTGSAHGKVVDADGNPIVGAHLELDSASGAQKPGGGLVEYTATTGADGTYNLTGIAEDSYNASVTGPLDANGFPLYAPYSLSADRSSLGASDDGSISMAGGQSSQIDARLSKHAVFKGSITDNLGNPIPASTVSAALLDVSDGNIVQLDEVMNGTWELVGPAGTYKVFFTSAGWSNTYVTQYWNNVATASAATPLTVTAGQVTANMNVILQPTVATAVPGAPTGVSAVAGNGQATVSWSAPSSTGGAPITGYVVTPFKGGVAQSSITVAGTGTSKVVTGLTNGTSYTFKVAAINGVGTGAQSSASAAVTPVVPGRTANQSFVVAAYTDFLGRAPTSTEMSTWTAKLEAGASRDSLVSTLANSHEWVSAIVTKLYLNTLGRQPDTSGLNYWTGLIISGRISVAATAASFYASDEYFAGIGHSDLGTWISDLYTKILHRDPESGALSYWEHIATAKGRVSVAYAIYQSVESRTDRVTDLYSELLGRVPDSTGLDYWVGELTKLGDVALARNLADSAEYFARAHTRFP